ncbi:hypothetical protein BCR44DRAFT_88490 [Catenaria anguillulae PL171]|uniref:Uncharacterized protein n=1 Tax=Catenaria anguillulae PL171 TaxID=765915 RepID=A0A1Y2HD45_9FUNG|nr:hypothetical protein BCR44DRAFT_88490 [Catenaria anguillulae PL171]
MSMTLPGGSKNSSFASATAAAEATARVELPSPNPARSTATNSPIRPMPSAVAHRSSAHSWTPTTASIIETGATPHGTLSHASNSPRDQNVDPRSSPSPSKGPSFSPLQQQRQQQQPYTNPVSTPHTTVFASHSRRGSAIGFDSSRTSTTTSSNATMATANNNPPNRDVSTASLSSSYGTAAPLPSTNVLYNDPASASVLDALRSSMAGTFESMTNGPRSIDSSNSASSRLRPELLADAIASHPMHRPLLVYHMTRYIFFTSVEPARSVDPNAPRLSMMLATDRLDQALATISSLVHQDSEPWTELAVALAVWLAGDTTDALIWFRGAMLQAFPARPNTPSPDQDSSSAAEDKPMVGDGLISEWGIAVCTKMLRILRLTGDIEGMEQVLRAWSRSTLRSIDPKDVESKAAVDFVRHLALACALDDVGKHMAARKHWAAMFPDAFTDPSRVMNDDDSLSLPGAQTPTISSATGSIPLGLADPAVHRLADHLLATLPVSSAYETILDVISISNLSMTQFAPLLTILALSAGRQDSAAGYTIMWARSRGVQSDNWASMWAPLMGALVSTSGQLPPHAITRRIANWGDPCDAAMLTDVVGMWIRAHGSVKGLRIPGKPNDALCPSVHATAHGFDVEVPATAVAGVGLLGGVVRVAGRWAFDRNGQFLEPVVLRDHRQNGGGISECGMEPVVIESVEYMDGSTKKIRSLMLWFDHLVAIDTRLDGSEKSLVLDVRSLSSIIKSQGVLPLGATAQVRLEQKHRWTRNVVSLMGTYVIQRKPSATTQSVHSDDILADDEDDNEPFNFFHPIHLLPKGNDSPNSNRILHPEVPPYPVAPTYLEFLMDPPRSVFIDNTATTVENKPALAVTLTWELDHSSGKRRYTSHVFHIDCHTATFTPVDVLVNFRLCIAMANQWTIGLIPGSRPQIVKLDASNKEIQRVTVGVLTPVHPPMAGAAPSVAKGVSGGSSSSSKSTNSPSSNSKPAPPPCALEYWSQVKCAIFIAYTMVVVYSIDSMAVIMQLEFSGSNNPRETLHERSLTVCDKSQTHLVVAAGRNLFVLHSPEDDPLAGMTLACYIPLPALPNHVHCELDSDTGMVRVVHVLSAGTGSSQYFRFVVGAQLADSGMGGSGSPDPLKVTGIVALRGWNTCVYLRNGGADKSGSSVDGRGCMVIADPTGVMLLQDQGDVFCDAK